MAPPAVTDGVRLSYYPECFRNDWLNLGLSNAFLINGSNIINYDTRKKFEAKPEIY